MKNLIHLNGKETKSELIRKLIKNGAKWEGRPEDSGWHYKNDTKNDLLRKVKIFNANVSAGGDGDISLYSNKYAHSYKEKIDKNIETWLASYGIDAKLIPEKIPIEKRTKIIKQWTDYLAEKHNGFIGHLDVENGIKKMKELFINNSQFLGVELKY